VTVVHKITDERLVEARRALGDRTYTPITGEELASVLDELGIYRYYDKAKESYVDRELALLRKIERLQSAFTILRELRNAQTALDEANSAWSQAGARGDWPMPTDEVRAAGARLAAVELDADTLLRNVK
jgi:hypothetical protein